MTKIVKDRSYGGKSSILPQWWKSLTVDGKTPFQNSKYTQYLNK